MRLGNCWAMEAAAFEQFKGELVRMCSGGKGPWARADDLREKKARAAASLEARLASGGSPAGLAAQAAELGLLMMSGPVAVVPVRGVMIKDFGVDAEYYGVADTRLVGLAVSAAAADPEVSAMLLRMDTPGGSVDGIAELADVIYAARGVKSVIGQVDGMMASAGVYAGSQVSRIYAHRMDMVGSIGVRWGMYDLSAMFAEMGVRPIPLATSVFKSAGMAGTEVTPVQEAEFQRIVDGFFDDFKAMVMRGRGMTQTALAQVADARMHFAADAQALGLIDGVQTFDQTLGGMLSAINAGVMQRTNTARARARVMGS